MQRHEVAERVGTEIYTAEEALDEALGRASKLVSALVDARRDARLSTTVGHDIFESLGEASNSLMTARGAFVQAHKRLDTLRRALKLQPMASGPVDKDVVPHAVIQAVPSRAA